MVTNCVTSSSVAYVTISLLLCVHRPISILIVCWKTIQRFRELILKSWFRWVKQLRHVCVLFDMVDLFVKHKHKHVCGWPRSVFRNYKCSPTQTCLSCLTYWNHAFTYWLTYLLKPKLHYTDLLWICCTTNSQQIYNKLYSSLVVVDLSWICTGFVVNLLWICCKTNKWTDDL